MIKKLLPASIRHKLRVFSLKGENTHCPICEKRFISFMPFGLIPRANALCPNCGTLERTRLIWLFLKSQDGFFKEKKKVLHVAPEAELFKRFNRLPSFDYLAVDKFEEGYDYPKGTQNMDITAINKDDNSFDFILCSHVLEHVPDDKLAMRELFRVLKPGGIAILQVPLDKGLDVTNEDPAINSAELREQHYGHWDHLRQYGLDYKNRLEQAGFVVDVNDFNAKFSEADRFKFGLPAVEDLYICSKPV